MFVKTATDKTLKQNLSEKTLVLVDFGAENWCAPCRALAPTLEKVASERSDSLAVFKVDIDDNQITPQQYKVQGVPTMVLFCNGTEVSRKTGNMAKGALDAWLNSELEKVGG
jgi:thioredoxin 1